MDRIRPAFRNVWFVCGESVYHPDGVKPERERYATERRHAAVFVRQQQRLGLFWFLVLWLCLPLPYLGWGRWWLVRQAWLEAEIRTSGMLPEAVVERLSGPPRRRRSMLAWFRQQEGV